MRELVPRDYYDPVPVRRSSARQMARIQQQALVGRGALAAREHNAAYVVERRIDNGYKLAAQTVQHATRLNRVVTEVTKDNPGLELTLRGIEESVARGAQSLINDYMTR